MGVRTIAVVVLCLALILEGLTGGNPWFAVVGAVVLALLWGFNRSQHRSIWVDLIKKDYPGATAAIRPGQSGMTIGYLAGIPREQAIDVVNRTMGSMRLAYPRKSQLGVVVRDSDGMLWGTDYLHTQPPYAALTLECASVPVGNPLVTVALKAGSFVKGSDGGYYKVEFAPPWGPERTEMPMGHGLGGAQQAHRAECQSVE